MMAFSVDQCDQSVVHLPAQDPLAEGLTHALFHVMLIAIGQHIVLDGGAELQAAAGRQGLYGKLHHGPAGLGHGVFFQTPAGTAGLLPVNDGRLRKFGF